MDEEVVMDSFAWFEYFAGSEMGEKVKGYVEQGKTFTPAIVVAELSEKYSKLNLDFSGKFQFIKFNSRVVPLDEGIAELSGKLSGERKKKIKGWSLADSIILATARTLKAKVVTGDEHFRDLTEETIMIK